ncbi:hypothetical protein K438DRAFT_1841412 [Mycena galopus ATCC 62051]|nr:hypothetical protein K438DRAFT_1841412 [Mycena galopus ATCC 62051]
MHESLCLPVLDGLPVGQRAIAKAAVDGSLPRLDAVVRIVELAPKDIRFLPVFYWHIDPMKIPTDDVMDTEIFLDDTLATITRAFLSLKGLSKLSSSPPESHFDLWERIWPWVQFFNVYPSPIPGAPSGDVVRARLFSLIISLTNPPTSRRIASTPGFGILVAQVWGSYFRDPNPATEKALRYVALFLAPWDDRYDLDEFFEGAGGVHGLALLVVRLIAYLRDCTLVPHRKASLMSGVIVFAMRPKSDAWSSALRSSKYIRTMVSVLLFAGRLLEVPSETVELYQELYNVAWSGLRQELAPSPGYIHIVEAIDAGYLQALVSFDTGRNRGDGMANDMQMALNTLIRPATVYYPVLAALERCLPHMTESTFTPVFISSVLYSDWQELVDVVLDRLKVKRQFDSGQHLTRKACDYEECGRIQRKTDFKRCAGCKRLYYCSKECQIKDWRAQHRRTCKHTRPLYGPFLNGPTYLTGRDRAFLRALLAHDYQRHKKSIFLEWIVQMRQHGEDMYMLFDYRYGFVRIKVRTEELVRSVGEGTGPVRSNRRLQYSAIAVASSPEDGQWLLSIRSSASDVQDALVILSQNLPPDTSAVSDLCPDVHRSVTELIETVCPTVVEIVSIVPGSIRQLSKNDAHSPKG